MRGWQFTCQICGGTSLMTCSNIDSDIRTELLAVEFGPGGVYFRSTPEQDNSIPPNLEPVKVTLTPKRYKELVASEKNNKSYRSINRTDELECCICLDEFKKGCTIHRTSCNHHFHPKCLGQYLKKECLTPTCPMCRKDLRE